MRKLYIGLDDTYKDTECYMRHMLKANGVKLPSGMGDLYQVILQGKLISGAESLETVGVELINKALLDGKNVELYKEIYRVYLDVISNYEVVPFVSGVESSLDLLKTEYDIEIITVLNSQEEIGLVSGYLSSLGVPGKALLYGEGYSSLDMDGILVSNTKCLLNDFKASEKYQFPSLYTPAYRGVEIALDWYSLTDKLMGVDVGSDIKSGVFRGIPIGSYIK